MLYFKTEISGLKTKTLKKGSQDHVLEDWYWDLFETIPWLQKMPHYNNSITDTTPPPLPSSPIPWIQKWMWRRPTCIHRLRVVARTLNAEIISIDPFWYMISIGAVWYMIRRSLVSKRLKLRPTFTHNWNRSLFHHRRCVGNYYFPCISKVINGNCRLQSEYYCSINLSWPHSRLLQKCQRCNYCTVKMTNA